MALRDPVTSFVVDQAKTQPWITKVVLFGSRARGDFRENSDYDIAVEILPNTNAKWAEWSLMIKERVPTLAGIDIVKLDASTATDLRQAIANEGITIYEK
jgi:predicted nucleotidyltransferase